MGPIEESLRENPPPPRYLGGRRSIPTFGKSYPRLSEESAYNTSKAASRELVDYLLGGSALNCIGHRACERRARHAEMHVQLGELARQKELVGGQERNLLHMATRNGAWLRAVPHCLYGTDFLGRNSGIIFASDMG